MSANSFFSSLASVKATDDNPFETSLVAGQIPPALLAGLSYYLGTWVGFAWTPTGQPNSAFWPANAILLASFLLVPQRSWWTLLLAVLPAHMIAQLSAGVPVWTAVGWFVTNTSEALIGAFCITRFSDPRSVFDTVRGLSVFVVFGVLVAPLATSFLDAAAVVITGWGRNYWPLGIERFWTNALAALTMVPVIVLCGSNGISWSRKASAIRYSEAALLGVSTVLAAFAIFGSKTLWPSIPALLYVPLPLLLWAAARFGLGGLSLTLLSMALISIWYVIHGREPFPHVSMAQNVLSLQILFSMVALPLMFLATVMDEQRRTQASLRKTTGSLIEAQEQERRRIGRELHDDINQRLAMLAIEIDEILENPSESRGRLQEARKRATEISEDVQALSHELHASKLEHLGVVAGIKSWCKEFSARHKMEINCRTAVSNVVPLEIGISLFRVLQEAAHNTFKHSGVKHLDVQLREVSGEIHLTITDSGRGFDVETAMQGHGLGLTSMRERARLVGGAISIETKPMHGTTIQVRVPLKSEDDSQLAS